MMIPILKTSLVNSLESGMIWIPSSISFTIRQGTANLPPRQAAQTVFASEREQPSPNVHFLGENSWIHFTGYKTGSLLRTNWRNGGSATVYWLDFGTTCFPCLILQDARCPHTSWVTPDVVWHWGILHGLNTRRADPLYLSSGRLFS